MDPQNVPLQVGFEATNFTQASAIAAFLRTFVTQTTPTV